MTDKYILDENNVPVPCDDLLKWGRWFGTADRHVGLDEIGGMRVSAVFLGIDHRFVGDGPPILYETMIFGGRYADYQTRCSTREEALKQHAEAVELVRNSNGID